MGLSMKYPVITEIVEADLCIGCGLCAGVCPSGALKMRWNRYGEYNPFPQSPCLTECGLCQKVCPFADTGEDEGTIGHHLYGEIPGISHCPEAGYYLTTSAGYSGEHRERSSSGGMATWLLEELLSRGIVDHAVCVAPTGDPKQLFAFTICDSPEMVRTGAGSAYYPVELSAVIGRILEVPGRYAITGLPCFIKAVRLAQLRNRRLRERIVVCVGLTCGQLKSRHFTDYIAALAGVQGELVTVRYRGKSPDRPAHDYHYLFRDREGHEARVFSSEGIAEAWVNRWFTPNACNYCDDIFAECADVTCMDAWLPEYFRDYRGTNLVMVRSPIITDLIAGGVAKGEIQADPVPVQDLIRSQAGVVDLKRRHLASRLYLDQQKGLRVPKKRVSPKKPVDPLLRWEILLKESMRLRSRDLWILGSLDLEQFRGRMRSRMAGVATVRFVSMVVRYMGRKIRMMLRKVRRDHHE